MIRKNIIHFVLYIAEVLIYTSLALTSIEYINNKTYFKWTSNLLSYDIAEKAVALFLIYQILVFAILTLKDSSRKDALLSNIKVIKLAIVRFEHHVDFSNELESAYRVYFDKTVFFTNEDRKFIKILNDNYNLFINKKMDDNNYYFYLKNELVNLEHKYEMHNLDWRLSFLLRLVK